MSGEPSRKRSELLELKRSLSKALAKEGTSAIGVDVPRALDILNLIEATRPTFTMLKETKVGKFISGLKKSEHPSISKKAKTLVRTWSKEAKVYSCEYFGGRNTCKHVVEMFPDSLYEFQFSFLSSHFSCA